MRHVTYTLIACLNCAGNLCFYMYVYFSLFSSPPPSLSLSLSSSSLPPSLTHSLTHTLTASWLPHRASPSPDPSPHRATEVPGTSLHHGASTNQEGPHTRTGWSPFPPPPPLPPNHPLNNYMYLRNTSCTCTMSCM